MDVLLPSRLQFEFPLMFHCLLPPLTIGPRAVMVGVEAMYLSTRYPPYPNGLGDQGASTGGHDFRP